MLIKQKSDNSLFEVSFVNKLDPAAIFLDPPICMAKPQKKGYFD